MPACCSDTCGWDCKDCHNISYWTAHPHIMCSFVDVHSSLVLVATSCRQCALLICCCIILCSCEGYSAFRGAGCPFICCTLSVSQLAVPALLDAFCYSSFYEGFLDNLLSVGAVCHLLGCCAGRTSVTIRASYVPDQIHCLLLLLLYRPQAACSIRPRVILCATSKRPLSHPYGIQHTLRSR